MRSTPPVRPIDPDDRPGPEDLQIRPSTSSDIEDFYELASLAGAGFTSLPANEALLAERLAASESAFAGEPGVLTLALEDRRTSTVVGCAAIKPGGMPRADFLNFRISADGGSLEATARYADLTEVGSLLLHPDYRNGGIGPFLARSRYLLIASDPVRFGERIFSELRGVVDEDDRSPFYDAVCSPYFDCSFAEADDLCAHGRQAELNARLPDTPIPLNGLPSDALDAMGRPHRSGRRALDYLDGEGFRFEGVVDLLDGGPAVVAPMRQVGSIRRSFEAQLQAGDVDEELAVDASIALGVGLDYRCGRVPIALRGGTIVCAPTHLAPLGIETGAVARICIADEAGGGQPAKSGRRAAASCPEPFAGLNAGSD